MCNATVQYLREVDRQIICPPSLKKPFLRQLKNEALCYCSDSGNTDMDTLSGQFGAPEEIAKEFMSALGEKAVDRCVRTRKSVFRLILAVVFAAVVFSVILAVRTHALRQTLPDGDFVASVSYDEADRDNLSSPSGDTFFAGNSYSASPSNQ